MKRREWNRLRQSVSVDAVLNLLPPTNFYNNQSDQALLDLAVSDYLKTCGFLESIAFRRPQKHGLPIPWFTFPALEYIEGLPLDGLRLVEIGSGFSTLYWQRRNLSGISLESDREWTARIDKALHAVKTHPTISVHHISEFARHLQPDFDQQTFAGVDAHSLFLGESDKEVAQRGYAKPLFTSLRDLLGDADVVVIDGVLRNMCMSMAARICGPRTLIIVDNSDRHEYAAGSEELRRLGWKQASFTGLGPLNPYQWSTSIWTQ